MPDVEIKVRENGPYRVKGPITLIDADGNEYDLAPHEKNGTIALCRCGGSPTQPFLGRRTRKALLRRPPLGARLRGRRAGRGGRGRPLRGNLPPGANIERLDRRDEPPPVEHLRYRPGAKSSLARLTLGVWARAPQSSSALSAATRAPSGTGA